MSLQQALDKLHAAALANLAANRLLTVVLMEQNRILGVPEDQIVARLGHLSDEERAKTLAIYEARKR